MARRINWGRPTKETNKALAKTKKMTTAQAYSYLKKVKAPKVQLLTDIKAVAKKKSKQHKVPIIVTKNFRVKNSVRGHYNTEDGIVVSSPRLQVRIHPILRYYSPKYTRDVMDHELDHVKVIRKKK